MSRALTIDEAAEDLRVSRRWLEYWLADHPVDATGTPFYVPMGRRKTFEQNDIARIRACIREEERCRLSFTGVARTGHSIIAEQLARLTAVENEPYSHFCNRLLRHRWRCLVRHHDS